MRREYQNTAQLFKERVDRVVKILEDRTIDNTMVCRCVSVWCVCVRWLLLFVFSSHLFCSSQRTCSPLSLFHSHYTLTRTHTHTHTRTISQAGARRRIEEFYDYKTKDKNIILGHQLDLQALFNNLAMRLSHHKVREREGRRRREEGMEDREAGGRREERTRRRCHCKHFWNIPTYLDIFFFLSHYLRDINSALSLFPLLAWHWRTLMPLSSTWKLANRRER